MRIKKYLRVNKSGHFIKIGKIKVRTPLIVEIPTKQDEVFLESTVVGKIETAEIITESDLKKKKPTNKDNYNLNGFKEPIKLESIIQKDYKVESFEKKESVIPNSAPEWLEGNNEDEQSSKSTRRPKPKKSRRRNKEVTRKKQLQSKLEEENISNDVGKTNFSHLRQNVDSDIEDNDFEDFCFEDEYDDEDCKNGGNSNGGFNSSMG